MKLLCLSILATAILFPLSFAYGLTIPMTTQEVLDEFDMILLGTVTDVKIVKGKAPAFTIEIEDVVKKLDSFGTSKTVLAFGCSPNSGIAGIQCPSYEVGQRGLFLLVSSKNDYDISSYSQVAEPHCTSEQFLANYKGRQSGLSWTQDGQSETFFTEKPVDIHYTVNNRDMKEKDYSVMLSAYSNKFAFSDVINGTVNECAGSKVVTASFIPKIMGTYGTNAIYDGGSFGSFGISIIDYDSTPLEQYKAGIHGQDTWCKDGLIIDYYDEAWNGWNEDSTYDKFEKAQENAQHPKSTKLNILNESAVMIKEYFWENGEQQSFNNLEVFLDEEQIRIKSSLPEEELIKIAESMMEQN
ncbi:MAG: hypothetical protein KGZ34_02770 [Nitrosarchaeum sp.]|nr:hypothetical protein [Nitrosarchaeum sp.]